MAPFGAISFLYYFLEEKIFLIFATRSLEISMFTAIPIITPIAVSKIRFSGYVINWSTGVLNKIIHKTTPPG